MNSNATNKTRTGPKWARTQEPEDELLEATKSLFQCAL